MSMKKKLLITNIQRFSLHDGPGIRTTVFFKGCSLCCPWCSNPENRNPNPEHYIMDGENGIYGEYLSCDELYHEVMKDKGFYCRGLGNGLDALPGGVTFSGGEVLLQIDTLKPLLRKLKTEHIHMAVESCLFAPIEKLQISIQYIDLFYVDMKILDTKKCHEVEHGNLDLYLSNLDVLMKSERPVVIRVPVIGGYTDIKANRMIVVELLRRYKPLKVELIKEHNLGELKYRSLALPVPDNIGVSDELMEQYKNEIAETGILVEVCKI